MNSVPDSYICDMRVDIPGVIRVAQARGYTAAQLAQCFHGMGRGTAQLLLDGAYTINDEGQVEVTNTSP